MPINIEPLLKIIELEKKRGYLDSAVIGGLDKFLHNWARQYLELPNSPERSFISTLVNSSYSSLTPEKRKNWLGSLLGHLAGVEKPQEVNVQKTSPVRRRSRRALVSTTVSKKNGLDSSITVVRGIGSSLADKFGRLGVKTVRDLLYFFPRRHLDYTMTKSISQLVEGEEQTIIANIWQSSVTMLGGRRGTEAIMGDETGNIRAVWFNQPYLAKRLATNTRVVLSGKVSLFKGRYVFESPEWEILEDKDLIHTARLVPVYPLTEGLYPRQVRKVMKEVIDSWAWQLEDFLPHDLKQRCHLLDLPQAVAQAHFPEDSSAKDKARLRLAFDELFLLQLGVIGKKHDRQNNQPGNSFDVELPVLKKFLESLPFRLTEAQSRVLGDILTDLHKVQPMCRLLQGDVGSGKTVVATAALLLAAANGFQSAFMAPTEILAEQHFATLCSLLSRVAHQEGEGCIASYPALLPRPLKLAILTGDVNESRKQEIQKGILDGEIDIIIGTHALIQKDVSFKSLGLVVVDEQHRFGVAQRATLRQKGLNAHMLVMTATPIPRTLALTLYGDLDLSVIDQLPPGRQEVKTRWLKHSQRGSAYAFIRRQAAASRQCFIICPLIEESESLEAQSAVAEYQKLSEEVFPDLRLGLLHGRMSSAEKDEVMHRFRSSEMDILVSTPVIEVGIDVPNATVMLVESADRFGLSQLHQFRGRVGRGKEQSYCMLLSDNPSEVARQRLDIIEHVQDGFTLAEEDLKLRGPGEFFGTRQSGLPDLRMAKLSDMGLLELARNEAASLFSQDPCLAGHRLLAAELARVWSSAVENGAEGFGKEP